MTEETVIVEQDIDTYEWCESSRYGWRISKELWDEYQAAEQRVNELSDRINKEGVCVPYPVPPAGTLARAMYDDYREMALRAFTFPLWGRPHESQDDGTLRKLEEALAPKN